MDKNKVFGGDILGLLRSLPDASVDAVFSDQGNMTAADGGRLTLDGYVSECGETAKEIKRVLKPDGNAFFIGRPKYNSYLRVRELDGLFAEVYEYVWVYNVNAGTAQKKFTSAHRSILHCRISGEGKWYKDAVAEPYRNPLDKRVLRSVRMGARGRMPYSWLYYNIVKTGSKDKNLYHCSVPSELFVKLLYASTLRGDNVLVTYPGEGGELLLTKGNGRSFITAEPDEAKRREITEMLENFRIGDDDERAKRTARGRRGGDSQISLF